MDNRLENVEKDSDDEESKSSILQVISDINSQTELKATARVLGVMKSLNKTYGGSIVASEGLSQNSIAQLNKFY